MGGTAPGSLLDISRLSKAFPGTQALSDVSLELHVGQIHALLGQNGAGKSTLIKVLAGAYAADSGAIRLDGDIVDPTQHRLPMSFVHQDLALVDSMTVAENIALVAGYSRPGWRISWRSTQRRAAELLETMGSNVRGDAVMSELSPADRSVVAIARALAVRAKVMVLDEPTAALPQKDVAHLFGILRNLRDAGLGILYVTHRLDEVFALADWATVLRDGRRVASASTSVLSPSELIVAIVGKNLTEAVIPPSRLGPITMSVQNVSVGGREPASFGVRAGEVTALVGLRGAGHEELGRALAGAKKLSGGTIHLDGSALPSLTPRMAARIGIGLAPGDRAREALATSLTVRENLFLNPGLTPSRRLFKIGTKAERARAVHLLERFGVRPLDPDRPISTLSGGNQQKAVIARVLTTARKLVVLHEPTAGVDVGAKEEIYNIIVGLLNAGMAVVIVSSDFDEVARLAHKAVIFRDLKLIASLESSELTSERLTSLSTGGES